MHDSLKSVALDQERTSSSIIVSKLEYAQCTGGRPVKAAYSVTFDLLILEFMFLFFKNTVKKTKI